MKNKPKKSLTLSLRIPPNFFSTLLVVLGVVLVWKGVWGLVDLYVFPGRPFLSSMISLVVGLIILYLPDQDLKELL